jgi:Tfp pilus assembly protein FimT
LSLRSKNARKSNIHRGFSTVELTIVVAIILIVGGLVLPNITQIWYNMELKSVTAQTADLMQQARMLAAKNNQTYPIGFRVNNGVQQVYIDLNRNGSLDVGEPYIDLGRTIVAASGAPNGSNGRPSAYTFAMDTSSGTPCDNTCTLAFHPRGLPCKYDTTTSPPTCSTPAASYFVYYFQDQRPNGWSAVLVTKAGRTKSLLWNGSSWH